ncbi:MAG: biopolymer transporter ExbD [Myxococcota bacterium]
MRFVTTRRPDATIDVTPMIDVVFQLVLFFMVSTNFIETPGLQVDLPRSSPQTVLSDKKDVNIWMTLDDEIYIDDEPVDLAGLTARLEARALEAPETLVVIKADTGVSHGRVVTVMDRAKSLGLSRLAIATEATADDGN